MENGLYPVNVIPSTFFNFFQPTLPSTALCKVCEENLPDDDDTLMECASCGKIVHPTCMPAKGYFHVVPELNNCWKCPECCDKHTVCVKLWFASSFTLCCYCSFTPVATFSCLPVLAWKVYMNVISTCFMYENISKPSVLKAFSLFSFLFLCGVSNVCAVVAHIVSTENCLTAVGIDPATFCLLVQCSTKSTQIYR